MKNKFYSAIIFVLICPHIVSQDISNTIYSLLNFHSHTIITSSDLYTKTSKISSGFVYNDYYRKYINGQQTVDWNGYNKEISTWHSQIGKDLNYGLKTNIQYSEYDFQNIQDKKAVRLQNNIEFNSIELKIAVSDKKSVVGGGMIYRKIKNNMPLLITEFPSSIDDDINEYFLDFLEPTFGENVSINGNSVMKNPIIFTSFPVNEKYYMTILYSYLFQKYNIDIYYTNSSNIDKLKGNRSIEIPADIRNSFIQTMLSKKSSSIQTSATYFNTDINLPFDNIIPFNNEDSLDLDVLGLLQVAHNGGSIELNYSKNNYQLLLGFGLGNLSGAVEMVTPVLGRKFFILPIFHGVRGKITGTNSSQKISINYNKIIKNTEFVLLSSYTHSYYDLLIDGNAYKLANLTSTPIYSTLNYHAHFFDFWGKIKQQIGSIHIIFSLNQIIPIIKRKDSAPIKYIDGTEYSPEIKFIHETEYSPEHRGGLSYSISIQYSW